MGSGDSHMQLQEMAVSDTKPWNKTGSIILKDRKLCTVDRIRSRPNTPKMSPQSRKADPMATV